MLRQESDHWVVETPGSRFVDLTAKIQDWLQHKGAGEGLITIFIPHTSASLTIQENTDPDVLLDLADALERAAPRRHPYRHSLEGPDDMPAHIKAMLTLTSVSIPVLDGRAALGTWQAVYLIEHRQRRHERRILLHYVGT